MLAVLVSEWGLILFRGLLALVFGTIVLFTPGATLAFLVLLFGGYTLVDAIFALLVASGTQGLHGSGSLISEGLVRGIVGAIACFSPGMTSNGLVALMAFWAASSGIAEIATAMALRAELTGEWPLPVAGALSIIFSVLLVLSRGRGVLGLTWLIGGYGVLFGIPLVILSLRLRQLAHEMAGA
jgi:uncharacterized membrane protein HdeD (DUF308 family)